jgi:tripartite-type tricarboxylate transporter receptor subunit TctC
MMLTRRNALRIVSGALGMPFVSRTAWAQVYPNRPVKIIVGFPAGGPSDATARLIASWLTESVGQQFIVENRPGAGGTLATESVVRSPADGYTLEIVSTAETVAQSSYENLSFNIVRDLVGIAPIGIGPTLLLANPNFPVRTVAELIAYAKAQPGKVNYGSTGVGTTQHLAPELLKLLTGIEMTHIPYRGSAPALTDLIAGQVDIMIDSITSSIEHVRSGKLRVLAVGSAKRLAMMPDIPAIAETLPGFEVLSFVGVAAPRRTPAPIIALLHKAISDGVASSRIREWHANLGREPMFMSQDDFDKYIANETERWAKVVKFANIKVK